MSGRVAVPQCSFRVLLGARGKMVLWETSAHLSLASSLPGRLSIGFLLYGACEDLAGGKRTVSFSPCVGFIHTYSIGSMSFIVVPKTWEKQIVNFKTHLWGFPGGAVVESLPAGAGDTGLSPGLGGSHMPRSDWAREPQLLSLRVWSLCSATREAATVRGGPRTAMKSGPYLPQLEKAHAQKRRPNTAKNKKKQNKPIYVVRNPFV